MLGLLGKKVGMTSYFAPDGSSVACTLVEVGPCTVTQVKTEENDSYSAVQIGFGEKKEKNTTEPELGHFKKAKTTPKEHVIEFREYGKNCQLGDVLTVADLFKEGDKISVVGQSKGKGFQGVVKRHNFNGVGGRTHGQHNRQRHPGSVGASSFPSRVFKGIRMAGRTGNDRIKVKNLKVVKVYPEQNLMLISGSVPGAKRSLLILEK